MKWWNINKHYIFEPEARGRGEQDLSFLLKIRENGASLVGSLGGWVVTHTLGKSSPILWNTGGMLLLNNCKTKNYALWHKNPLFTIFVLMRIAHAHTHTHTHMHARTHTHTECCLWFFLFSPVSLSYWPAKGGGGRGCAGSYSGRWQEHLTNQTSFMNSVICSAMIHITFDSY